MFVAGISQGAGTGPAQWESGNLFSRFPFADDCPLPNGFPLDALVDLCVVAPHFAGEEPRDVWAGCVYAGPSAVSVTVCDADGPILYAVATPSSLREFAPVAMEAARPGFSGSVSFGRVRFGGPPRVFRGRFPLSDSAVVRPVVGRLASFFDPLRGESASGDVGLVVPSGVSVSLREAGDASRLAFSLDAETAASLDAGCARDGEDVEGTYGVSGGVSVPVPVKRINGVAPDALGRIAIVFARDPEEVPA